MTEEMVLDMLDHRNSDLPERTKMALDLTEDFILNHARGVDDAMMARLKQHFSEDQIVELTVAIGIWDSVHKFNNVFDVDPPVDEGTFTVGDDTRNLGPGGVAWSAPDEVHGVENRGSDQLVLLVSMAPNPNDPGPGKGTGA